MKVLHKFITCKVYLLKDVLISLGSSKITRQVKYIWLLSIQRPTHHHPIIVITMRQVDISYSWQIIETLHWYSSIYIHIYQNQPSKVLTEWEGFLRVLRVVLFKVRLFMFLARRQKTVRAIPDQQRITAPTVLQTMTPENIMTTIHVHSYDYSVIHQFVDHEVA